MYNKDSLKPGKGRKLNNVIAVLMSALLATGAMIGCGSKAVNPGGGTADVEADVGNAGDTSEVSAAETVNDSANVSEAKDVVSDLPPQAYKTTEERQAQHVLDLDLKPMHSNQFLMIEEVINEPEEGWETTNNALNYDYLKLKGTLYQIYYYDEPATDLVYFPGDELPDGYEVDVIENYEIVIADEERIGEGHETTFSMFLYPIETNTEIVYEENCCFNDKYDLPEGSEREDIIEKYGRYIADVSIKKGMYVMIQPPDIYSLVNIYHIAQLLTKEDLEKLPAGTTIAHGVGHY